jgi:acyl CoA:acetate/3-ketoacid CoA transferase beta subunit
MIKQLRLLIILLAILNVCNTSYIYSNENPKYSNFGDPVKGFNYKAVIKNNGTIVQNKTIEVQFTILENGLSVYEEFHTPTTDSNGIIIVSIGEGTSLIGNFETINWSIAQLKVEIDTDNSGLKDMGTTDFKNVPLAKYAEIAGNVPTNISELTNDAGYLTSFTEVDGSTTNEIQDISISGNQLSITSGSTVTLPTSGGATYQAGTGIQIDTDNNIINTGDADASPTNELQTISKTGNTVTLSNGGGSFTDTDTNTQLTEGEVDAMVNNNGYLTSFTEVDGSTTNELQTISKTGNTVTLSNGGGSFTDTDTNTQLSEAEVDAMVNNNGYLTSFTEVDGSTTNELQTISKTGNTVTLSNGGGSFTDTDTNTQLSEAEVDAMVNNNGYLTSFTEVDGSTTNEIQDISISGNQLSITNGSTVTLPTSGGATYQAGTGIQIDTDNNIINTGDADASPTNELQTISKTGNTVTLSNGGGSFTDTDTNTQLTEGEVDAMVNNNGYLTSFTEVDGSTTNELQTISITGDQLSISSGNTITLPASGGSSDADFYEVGTTDAPTDINADIFHVGNIAIGQDATPNAKIDIKNTGTATTLDANTGVTIQNNNTSDTDKIGLKTVLENPAANTAKAYGVKNNILDRGDGDIYGEYTKIGGLNGDGAHYGNYLYLTGEGNGLHTGSDVVLQTMGEAEQIAFNASVYTGNGSNSTNQVGVKTHVFGDGTGEKFGITNLLDGNADGNLYGTENTISNTNNYSHYGTINRMSGEGSGSHFATSNIITGAGTGKQYGVRNYNSSTGNDTHYGIYSDIKGSGSGLHIGVNNIMQGDGAGEQVAVLNEVSNTSNATHYGIKNVISGNGSGRHYGNYSELTGSGVGIQTGSYNKIASTGSSIHTGVQAELTGTANGAQQGIRTDIDNSGNGYHYGTITILEGSGSGQHVGGLNRLSGTGTGEQYGTKTIVNNSANATHYGNHTEISGSGSGTHYANYNVLSGTGTGIQYGANTIISNSNNNDQYGSHTEVTGDGNGIHYGSYVVLTGNGSNKKYGFYSDVSGSGAESKLGVYAKVDPAANGNHYAIYGKATRNTDNTYAGFFEGNVKVTDKLKGKDSGEADMKAYIYGNIDADASSPSIIANGSSDGFTLTRISTGVYKISFDNAVLAGANAFIAIATLNSQGDIWVSQKDYFSFRINIKNGLSWKDYDFQFVVYKK